MCPLDSAIWTDDAGNRFHDPELTHRIVTQPGPGDASATWCTVPGCDWRAP